MLNLLTVFEKEPSLNSAVIHSSLCRSHRKPFNHRAVVNSHLSDTAIRLLNTGHF